MTSTSKAGVVLITGASRGLGLGLACLMAEQRVPLLLTARGESAIGKVAAGLRDGGSAVASVAADASDSAAMDVAFRVAASLGTLDAVVNNAGVLEPVDRVADVDIGAFDQHLRTNITGVLVGTQLALRHCAPSHPIRIVNISSGAAEHAYAGWGAYCCSKAAITMLTRVAAKENSDGAVSIVSVAPGIIETQMQNLVRTMPPSRFPEVQKFVHLKESGALLHPVDAAVALDWLARFAPISLSGKFIDARSAETREEVEGYVRAGGDGMRDAIERARKRYDNLSVRLNGG